MLSTLASQQERDGKSRVSDTYQDKIEEAKMHIDRIKSILLTDESSKPVYEQARESESVDQKPAAH